MAEQDGIDRGRVDQAGQDQPNHDRAARRRDLAFEAVLPGLALAYAAYYLTDIWNSRFETALLGWIFSVLILLSALGVLVGAWRAGRPARAQPAVSPRSLILLAGVVVYVTLLHYAGYAIAVSVFLLLTLYWLGTRNWRLLLTLTIGFAASGYLVFETFIGSGLPEGRLWQ